MVGPVEALDARAPFRGIGLFTGPVQRAFIEVADGNDAALALLALVAVGVEHEPRPREDDAAGGQDVIDLVGERIGLRPEPRCPPLRIEGRNHGLRHGDGRMGDGEDEAAHRRDGTGVRLCWWSPGRVAPSGGGGDDGHHRQPCARVRAMITVDEARERILLGLRPCAAETVPLEDALFRTLVGDVVARIDQPSFDNSAMDGWAVRHADLGPGPLAVGETIIAGAAPMRPLHEGEAARIFTGARVPEGADTIVMQEWSERSPDGSSVRFTQRSKVGDHLRRRGADFRAGESLLAGGAALGPFQIGLLAGQGISHVRVVRRPIVAILATGDEVHGPGEWLAEGHIHSSNGPMLAALIRAAGAIPRDLGIARDDPDDLRRCLAAAAGADVVLTIGGVSVGDKDHVKDVVRSLGGVEDFWRVAMRPGKPNAFGTLGGSPYFGLPGNPVSCAVSFALFVLPAVQRLLGQPATGLRSAWVKAGEPLSGGKGLRHFLRVLVEERDGGPVARSAGPQGSAHLRPLARATALAVVPEGVDVVAEGAPIEVLWLPTSQ